MASSRAEKARNHDRILEMASARFREAGIDGVGVAALMREAGLTHGGFYRHFGSREDMVGEVVERAMENGRKALDPITMSKDDRRAVLAGLIDPYLSPAHRDRVSTSCPVTALARDVARSNDRARRAYTQSVASFFGVLTKLAAGDRPRTRRAKAIGALSTLVGALSLARAVNDEALSAEILKSAAAEVKARLG
jgi:TetR/AcrR family transcriptional repressor of nem operon